MRHSSTTNVPVKPNASRSGLRCAGRGATSRPPVGRVDHFLEFSATNTFPWTPPSGRHRPLSGSRGEPGRRCRQCTFGTEANSVGRHQRLHEVSARGWLVAQPWQATCAPQFKASAQGQRSGGQTYGGLVTEDDTHGNAADWGLNRDCYRTRTEYQRKCC